MSVIDTLESCPVDLIKAMNENCKAAENLAVQTIVSRDAPLINAFRELTRGDCWQIMRKQEVLNVLEQAIILSCLTDYITCAYQNELFDTFQKKQDRENFSSLLLHLNGRWTRFFYKLRQHDLTYAQLNSILFLLRQSLKRLPENYRTLYMGESLLIGERSLEKAHLQSYKDITQVADKLDATVHKNNEHHNTFVKIYKSLICNVEPVQENKCVESKTKITSRKYSSGSPKSSALLKRASEFDKAPVIDITSEPAVKTQCKKYKADITRYILKSTENKNKRPNATNVGTSVTEGKENLNHESSSPTGIELYIKPRDADTDVTPIVKLNSVIGTESPSKRKLQTEDKITVGKVNAFEMMMKQSKAIKDQSIKRKSLFQ